MNVVLLTGCSRGIGHHSALDLAARGWRVVATLRGEEGRAALEAAGVTVLSLDVTDHTAIQEVVAQTLARFGRLDAVVANAGTGLFGCFEDVDLTQARALFEVNVFGVLGLASAALPHLRASRGRLVVIGSIAGRRAAPGSSLYNATKYALEGWAEAISFELHPLGVPVVIIEPGPTESGFARAAWRGARVGTGPYAAFTEHLLALREASMGRPEPVSTVTAAIHRALTDPDPPLRIPTGASTKATILAARLLPGRLYRAAVRRKLKTTGSRS